jgi:hypothetical protein
MTRSPYATALLSERLEQDVTRRVAAIIRDERGEPLLKYMARCGGLGAEHLHGVRVPQCVLHHRPKGFRHRGYPMEQVTARLRREVAGIEPKRPLASEVFCDAYPTVEWHQGVPRAAIEGLIALRRCFVVVTKGSAVLRERELLTSYPQASVTVSLCSVNEDALRLVDLSAPSADGRLEVIHKFGCRQGGSNHQRSAVNPWCQRRAGVDRALSISAYPSASAYGTCSTT